MKTSTILFLASAVLTVYATPIPDDTTTVASATPPLVSTPSSDPDAAGNSSAPVLSNSSAPVLSNSSVPVLINSSSPGVDNSSTTVSNSSLLADFPADTKVIAVNEGSGNLAAYSGSGALLGNVQASAAAGVVPANTTHTNSTKVASALATDSNGAQTITYNTCRPATDDDLPLIPGYQKLLDAATKFANGQTPTRVYVNDPSYPTVLAHICYVTDTISLTPGTPTCSTTVAVLDAGQSPTGANMTMTHSVQTGQTTEITTTTTQTSSFAFSDTITATVGVPEVEGVSDALTFSTSVENTQGTTTESSHDTQTTDSVSYDSRPGANCPVQANTTTCTYDATGSIDVYITGNVWFEYKTRFRDPYCLQALIQPGAPCAGKNDKHPKNDLNHCYDANSCPTHGHYNWDIAESDTLPDMADRSNPIQIKNGLTSKDTGSYWSDCTNVTSKAN
ncbi:hypothetical protein C8R46DRAFT_1296683 [Mycena filopes]|nr:hypothetical protein C8R46DRAFT_1296683 [Mycena filopes]